MPPASNATLSDREFQSLRDWLFEVSGINMTAAKKTLVSSRLQRRLRELQLNSFSEYFAAITTDGASETQIAIDLLTTNETWFFREPKHFQFMQEQLLPNVNASDPMRVWSAASSTGEEPYSIAMTLAACRMRRAWEVFASDLSTRVLAKAASGHYALERAEHIPPEYLKRFCLRGVGSQQGTFLIDPALRQYMRFEQVNLNTAIPDVGEFDIIFLRNVMIYFEAQTKASIIKRLTQKLKPGGYLFIGHSDSLVGTNHRLKQVRTAIFQAA